MQQIEYRLSLHDTNVLKGVAFCAMLVHHLFVGAHVYGEIAFQMALLGKICVAVFVFLSGYGLAIQYGKSLRAEKNGKTSSTLKFLGRRFTKFYLNYWIIFAISVPLGVLFFNRPLHSVYGSDIYYYMFLDLLGLQGVCSYNATWWFNQLILYLYILFPFLYLVGRSWLIGLSFLILFFIWPVEVLHPVDVFYLPLSSYLIVFFLGIYVSIHSTNIANCLNRISPKVVLFGSGIILVFLCYCRNHVVFRHFYGVSTDPFISAVLALFVVCLNRLLGRVARPYQIKSLGFIGKHSMNLYLLHTFVISYFFSDFIYGFKNPLLIFLVALSVSLVLSMAIEFLKNKLGFYRLMNSILKKLD